LAQVNHIVDPAILEPEPTAIHAVWPFVVEVRLYVNVEIEDEYVVVTQKCCDRVVEQDVIVNVSPQSFGVGGGERKNGLYCRTRRRDRWRCR
jgi:hypothetical protein